MGMGWNRDGLRGRRRYDGMRAGRWAGGGRDGDVQYGGNIAEMRWKEMRWDWKEWPGGAAGGCPAGVPGMQKAPTTRPVPPLPAPRPPPRRPPRCIPAAAAALGSARCRPGAHGPAQLRPIRHGTARHGTARHGTARHGTARHGTARRSTAATRLCRRLFSHKYSRRRYQPGPGRAGPGHHPRHRLPLPARPRFGSARPRPGPHRFSPAPPGTRRDDARTQCLRVPAQRAALALSPGSAVRAGTAQPHLAAGGPRGAGARPPSQRFHFPPCGTQRSFRPPPTPPRCSICSPSAAGPAPAPSPDAAQRTARRPRSVRGSPRGRDSARARGGGGAELRAARLGAGHGAK